MQSGFERLVAGPYTLAQYQRCDPSIDHPRKQTLSVPHRFGVHKIAEQIQSPMPCCTKSSRCLLSGNAVFYSLTIRTPKSVSSATDRQCWAIENCIFRK